MKTIKQTFLATLLGVSLMSNSSIAQDEKQYYVTSTTLHWNMDNEDFSMDEWKAVEKEYLDKVVKKNSLILGQEVLTHYFTADNTELILVTTYESWDAIDKAGEKDDELIKAAWPDEKARKAFFEKKASYYDHKHSDEIYKTFAGAKLPKANFDKSMLYYVRESGIAYSKDGTMKEFMDLRNQYLNAVVYKNDFIKAYYPNVHAWGADNTKFVEVFVVESLCDIKSALDKNSELFKATWNTEAKSKEYGKKMEKYLSGTHGDYIYSSVPELTK